MRMPTTTSAAAGLLLFAVTSFAVGVLGADGSAATTSPAARGASCQQEGAAPQAGTRCTRERGERCTRTSEGNTAPEVKVTASEQKIVWGCRKGATPADCTPGASQQLLLQATATDAEADTLLYTWTTTGGRITGNNGEVTWDLSGTRPGTYTAIVEVDDGCGCVAFASAQMKVETCSGCDAPLR